MTRLSKTVPNVARVLSAVLCAAVAHCYFWRSDWCVAVTVWPAWVWALPGLLLLSLGFRRATKIASIALLVVWLIFVAMFTEEPRSLLRGLCRSSPLEETQRLRIVSLNCAGNSQAAREVAAFHPDLVLLQESPSQGQVQALAQSLYGPRAGVVWGLDASMIADGKLRPVSGHPQRGDFHFVQAQWQTPAGREMEVISVRLAPNTLRTDLWSPGCWREHSADRRQRREWLRTVAAQLHDLPCILGGDFNAPGGDAIVEGLKPKLYDVFAEAGRGWGDTLLNDLPIVRIDQIWVNRQLRALDVRAWRTQHSDHRAVVCDLVWR
jgi:hypothetical protein